MQKNQTNLLYEKESYLIRGCCYELYKQLGAGHKEVVYQRGLTKLLENRQLAVEREERIPIHVNGEIVGMYIPDLVINNTIVVELKSSNMLTAMDRQQFWRYLKLTPYKLGFLVNFGKLGGVEIVRRIYDTARNK